MFSSISWSQYFITVGLALVVYYIYVGFKYYGDELNALLKGKSVSPVITPSPTPNRTSPSQPSADSSLLGQTNPNRANIADTKSLVLPGQTNVNPEPVLPTPPVENTTKDIEGNEENEMIFETIDEIDLDISDNSEPQVNNSILLSDLVDLVDNVDNAIDEASENQVDKVLLSENLRRLLEPHKNALSSGIKEKISERITATTEQTGSAIISKEEVPSLWNDDSFFE